MSIVRTTRLVGLLALIGGTSASRAHTGGGSQKGGARNQPGIRPERSRKRCQVRRGRYHLVFAYKHEASGWQEGICRRTQTKHGRQEDHPVAGTRHGRAGVRRLSAGDVPVRPRCRDQRQKEQPSCLHRHSALLREFSPCTAKAVHGQASDPWIRFGPVLERPYGPGLPAVASKTHGPAGPPLAKRGQQPWSCGGVE